MQLHAQNREGLNYGLRIGALFANNKTAEYFNGGTNNALYHILNTPEYAQQISEYFDSDFSLVNPNYPAMMRYKPSLQIGGTLQYFFNEQLAFISTVNLSKVRSEGVFQIQLASPAQSPSMSDNLQEGFISSTENRFGLELGAHYGKSIKDSRISPFIEGGALIGALAAISNSMEIGDVSYTLYSTNNSTEDKHSYFGYGGFVSVGAQIPLDNIATFMLSLDMRGVKFSSLPPNAFTLQNSITVSVLF
jgi:hypothetical protein